MKTRVVLAAIVTGISLIVLIALGAWQWQRRAEKTALIATIGARIHLPAQPYPAQETWAKLDSADLNYRPVTLTGSFDHALEAHVFFSLSRPVGGVSGPGYLIITPFVLTGGGIVLINRGFVPDARKAATTRTEGQTGGQLTVTGLIRLPEARGAFSATDSAEKNVYFVRDPALLAKGLGLGAVAPLMVDLQSPPSPGGLPVPVVTQIDIPNHHLQYAMTWWSLAAVLLVIFILFVRRREETNAAR